MLSWLRNFWQAVAGTGATGTAARSVRASYDAAITNDENRRHWAWTDSLSARSANTLEVRRTLRERARYECDNNSYAKGIVLTLANHLIGSGPRLQVLTDDQTVNRQAEAAWSAWARGIRLVDKLRTLKLSKSIDGEGFGLLTTNEVLPTSVKLDIRLVECDQIATPFPQASWIGDYVDGVEYDPFGNPAVYHLLKMHPGATAFYPTWTAFDRIPARSMLHWFRADRPGQARGIPELTPSLPLFAQLRRFTQATISAAETAALFAAVIESAAPPDDTTDEPNPFETLEISRGMMTTLPPGAKLSQFRAEHPATTYEMFVWCIMREICRCLNVPLNIALGDSSKSNFSSARLDHLTYRQSVAVEREDCEREVLDLVFAAWADEAIMIPGLLPQGLSPLVPHCWHWPAWEPIDPKVEAETEEIRIRAGTGTLAEMAAGHGQDWRELIRQQEAEAAYRAQVRAELGVQATTTPTPGEASAEAEEEAVAA